MIILKTDEEIAKLRAGGRILSEILQTLMRRVEPGIGTGELDDLAEKLMLQAGGKPSFKGYRLHGVPPYNSTVCTSIDAEVVHGPAHPSRKVREGQLLKLDIGMWYQGLCTDMAATVMVGRVPETSAKLSEVTREALLIGIDKAREGAWISDIGRAVDKHVRRHGYTTVKDLVGHGVGKKVHEDPPIPNYHDRGADPVRISRGMVLAIEPMINLGEEDVETLDDQWTVAAADGLSSAHWEATIAITAAGTEILTPVPDLKV